MDILSQVLMLSSVYPAIREEVDEKGEGASVVLKLLGIAPNRFPANCGVDDAKTRAQPRTGLFTIIVCFAAGGEKMCNSISTFCGCSFLHVFKTNRI